MIGWHAARERYRVALNPLLTERRIELVALLLLLFLVLQLIYGGSRLALLSNPKAILPAADSLRVSDTHSQQRITMEQRSEIRDRPLLWPARRPFVAPAVVPNVKAPDPKPFEGFQLVGLFGTGDDVGTIVSLKGKAQRLRLGEKIGDWKLESVGINEVVFSSGSQQQTLVLKPVSVALPDISEKK